MRTQTERFQDLKDMFIRFSRDTDRESKIGEDYKRGLYTGWTECYKMTAKWIQEIIDNDNEK